jgi:hypothetical protein
MDDRRVPDGHEDPIRQHESLRYVTTDSPNSYLVESEIAMLGRLGNGGTPQARTKGRAVAAVLLVLILLPILLSAYNLIS